MSVFHVFQILQIVPNNAKRLMFLNYRRQNAFFIFFFSQGYVRTESR